jgi:Cu+-exporting ATPase
MKLVENAQAAKAPIQALADTISKFFVPFIILIALLTWTVWFIVIYTMPDPEAYINDESVGKFTFAFKFGIATMVIACPCALGLATPTAVMVATGIAANLGILIKGGDVLQKSSKINTVVFDKTGTLTTGIPQLKAKLHTSDAYSQHLAEYLTILCE